LKIQIDETLAVEVKAGAGYTPYYYHADGHASLNIQRLIKQ